MPHPIPAGPTAFTHCTLVDGRGGPPRTDAAVVVEGEHVAAVVGAGERFGPDCRVIDLGGRIVMPGLIDTHVHFAVWALNLLANHDRRIAYLAAKTVATLGEVLRAGCTGARDAGGLDPGFRDAVADGTVAGPHLRAAVTIISPTNGIADSTSVQGLASPLLPGMPSATCDGPDAARAKVREVLRAGADVIKLATTGGVNTPGAGPQARLFTAEEVRAIVDEAHAAGVPVMAHAVGGPGVLTAIRAGVDSLEHGGWLDDECVKELADRGTWYVPTFSIYHGHRTQGNPMRRDRALAMHPHHVDSFRRARAAGVRIAMGSDCGAYGHHVGLELELMVEAGMTPAEVITTSTLRSAECLGWGEEMGTVERGKRADLLVLNGDPTADVGVIRRPGGLHMVLRGGTVVG